jgi:hypothetical protein
VPAFVTRAGLIRVIIAVKRCFSHRVRHEHHDSVYPRGGQHGDSQDQQAKQCHSKASVQGSPHHVYLVILPIVEISSSTLCRRAAVLPVASTSATQWDT